MNKKTTGARLAEFVRYHNNGDGECNNVILKKWAEEHSLSLQERYELSYLFSVTYCVCSAIVLFGLRRFLPEKANEIKPKIIFQSDRKYMRMRNSFEETLVVFYGGNSDVNVFLNSTVRDGKIALDLAIPKVREWPMFGRFSAFLFLETFVSLTDTPIQNTTISWAEGDTATSGLLNIFGFDEQANAFDKTGKLPKGFTQEKMDSMLKIVLDAISRAGGDANVTKVETSLCAYRKFYKGSRYNGYYLDRMLEELYKMEPDFPEIVKEIFRIRSESVPRKYLGELWGWRGIRKYMKKSYIDSGVIV